MESLDAPGGGVVDCSPTPRTSRHGSDRRGIRSVHWETLFIATVLITISSITAWAVAACLMCWIANSPLSLWYCSSGKKKGREGRVQYTFFMVAQSVTSDSREKGEIVPLTMALILSWWLGRAPISTTKREVAESETP